MTVISGSLVNNHADNSNQIKSYINILKSLLDLEDVLKEHNLISAATCLNLAATLVDQEFERKCKINNHGGYNA